MKALFLIGFATLAGCSNLTNDVVSTRDSAISRKISPRIEFGAEACQRGGEKSHVIVMTEKENFNFNAPCGARFHQSFLVENAVQCVVESQMCAGFTGIGEMKVHCQNGESQTVNFDCTSL